MKISELFETPPFLEQRLGSNIFDEIPQEPGIYRFYDKENVLLYVGKTKNLRRRLFTYKRARPGKTSRKESALISRINRFEFDILESEEEAILQENRWIREHRPEFNYANKHTETYYFITVQRFESELIFGLSMNTSGRLFLENENPLYQAMSLSYSDPVQSKTYGCFKGHRQVRISLGALLQLLWMAEFGSISPYYLPVQLNRNLTPMRFRFTPKNSTAGGSAYLVSLLDDWFLGNSQELMNYLNVNISSEFKSAFTKTFISEKMEILESHFQKSLLRYQALRTMRPKEKSHLIRQEELDDLITRYYGI